MTEDKVEFLLTLNRELYNQLATQAKEDGITIEEYITSVVKKFSSQEHLQSGRLSSGSETACSQ
jgi:hypothetical protein